MVSLSLFYLLLFMSRKFACSTKFFIDEEDQLKKIIDTHSSNKNRSLLTQMLLQQQETQQQSVIPSSPQTLKRCQAKYHGLKEWFFNASPR